MAIRKRKRNKKKKTEGASFGKASIFAISIFFFLAIIMVTSSLMSHVVLEKYAKTQVAQSKVLSDRKTYLTAKESQGSIFIGEGVTMSEKCFVSTVSVVCKGV